MQKKDNFWEKKKLNQFTDAEWEQICDRCGKCCLVKIGVWHTRFTKIACPLLDICTGLCKNYTNRWDNVPECIKLTPENIKKCKKWLPKTCAYLWLLKKHTLPPWHPLVTGNKKSMENFGLTVKDRAIDYIEPADYRDFVVKWPDL